MSYKPTGIPMEVFESGKSEEYIEKTKAYQQADQKYTKAYKVWKKLLEKLNTNVERVMHDNRFGFIPTPMTYKANHNWKHSLLLEELSKELTDACAELELAASELMQAKQEVLQIYSKF